MKNILHLILKLKLINSKNFIFVIFQSLHKATNIALFKKIAILNSAKFKSLPFHYLFFEKILKKLDGNKIKFNFDGYNVL